MTHHSLSSLNGKLLVNPCMGIPDCIALDNGMTFTAKAVREACNSMAIEQIFMPPGMPWYKPHIERFGRTLNLRLVHWLVGTTLGRQTKRFEYDPQKHACITFDDLQEMVEFYVNNVHPYAPRREVRGTPLKRWNEGVARWPVRLPESREVFDAMLALTEMRELAQSGILFLGLHYNSDELVAIWNRIGGTGQIQFKVDPCDLNQIYVIDPSDDRAFKVTCTTPHSPPRSLAYHKQYRAWCRLNGRNPDDAAALTHNERALRFAMAESAAKGKRARNKFLRELEKSAEKFDVESSPTPALGGLLTKAALRNLDQLMGETEVGDEL